MSTIAALFLTSTVVLAAPGAEPDPGARAEIAVKAIAAKSPGVATVTSLTKTAAGHDVPVLRLSKLGQDAGTRVGLHQVPIVASISEKQFFRQRRLPVVFKDRCAGVCDAM